MTTRIGLALVAFAFALATTSSSADAQELVAIGHSGPAGYADGNIFAESQEWAFPALVAQSVGADYSPPSLVGTYSPERLLFLGFTAFPHFGTLEPSPYPGPLPNPTAGQVDMCGLHSGLGVPGETVHGGAVPRTVPPRPDFRCLRVREFVRLESRVYSHLSTLHGLLHRLPALLA